MWGKGKGSAEAFEKKEVESLNVTGIREEHSCCWVFPNGWEEMVWK